MMGKIFWVWSKGHVLYRMCFLFVVKERAQWLRLALSKGLNWVGVFHSPLTWGRKHPVSERVCFLVCRIPDDGQVQKPSDSECYTPSSEPFRIYPSALLNTWSAWRNACTTICWHFSSTPNPLIFVRRTLNLMQLSEGPVFRPRYRCYHFQCFSVGVWKLKL
jgi:hypothetical protein